MEKNHKIIFVILLLVITSVMGVAIINQDFASSLLRKKTTSTTTTAKNEIDEEHALLKDMKKSDITFDDEKINIYLFWGKGCPHCKDLATFLDTFSKNEKEKFNLYTFEVWYNKENAKFMEEFAELTDEKITGVPYYVIGTEVFKGYMPSHNKTIKEAIKNEYSKSVHFDYYKNSLK